MAIPIEFMRHCTLFQISVNRTSQTRSFQELQSNEWNRWTVASVNSSGKLTEGIPALVYKVFLTNSLSYTLLYQQNFGTVY